MDKHWKKKFKKILGITYFNGYFLQNFYVLRHMKHEYATFSLTSAYYLSRQADPIVCVLNHKIWRSAQRSCH